MVSKQRFSATLLAFVLGIGSLMLAAKPATASSERLWRYGTYLGAVGTGAALLKNRDTWALVGAGATALSYSQWRRSVRRRHEDERRARCYDASPRYSRYRSYRSYRSYGGGGGYGGGGDYYPASYERGYSSYGRGYSSYGRGYSSSYHRRRRASSCYRRPRRSSYRRVTYRTVTYRTVSYSRSGSYGGYRSRGYCR